MLRQMEHDDETLAATTGAEIAQLEQLADQIVQHAIDLGLTTILGKGGRTTAIGTHRPAATTLIGDLFNERKVSKGSAVFRLYSATAHATFSGLTQNVVVEQRNAEGWKPAYIEVDDENLLVDVRIALLGWMLSFDNAVHLLGWPRSEWDSWRTHLLRAL